MPRSVTPGRWSLGVVHVRPRRSLSMRFPGWRGGLSAHLPIGGLGFESTRRASFQCFFWFKTPRQPLGTAFRAAFYVRPSTRRSLSCPPAAPLSGCTGACTAGPFAAPVPLSVAPLGTSCGAPPPAATPAHSTSRCADVPGLAGGAFRGQPTAWSRIAAPGVRAHALVRGRAPRHRDGWHCTRRRR